MSELADEQAARLFHDTYERLAPSFGYETRPDTKQFDPNTPNGRLMIAVCAEVLTALRSTSGLEQAAETRWVTMWRKTGEQCLEWDYHVSDLESDVKQVIVNLKAQGVKQWHTYQLGSLLPEYSVDFNARKEKNDG